MKKLTPLFISLIAFAFALPAGAATVDKAQVQTDKAIATAPPTATMLILTAAADVKAKPAAKAKDGAKANAKKVEKEKAGTKSDDKKAKEKPKAKAADVKTNIWA